MIEDDRSLNFMNSIKNLSNIDNKINMIIDDYNRDQIWRQKKSCQHFR